MRKSRYLKIAAQRRPGPVRGPLVKVDSGPIRAAAQAKYRQAKAYFAKLQELLARFHDQDKPAFEKWLHDCFGDLVRTLRSAQAELNRLRELIFEVETRTWFNNQSCAAAYRDVLERQAHRRAHPGAASKDDLEEKMRAHMEAEAAEGESEHAAHDRPPIPGHRPAHLSAEKESRLKAAYRSMARRLHPDRHAHVTAQMRERWHEAQQAYMAGDVDLLESMESMCLDEETEIGNDTPVSHILERTLRMGTSTAQLVTKTQHSKKDPAWGFSELTDFSKLKKLMAKTLPLDIKSAKTEITILQEKIELWQADAERFYPNFKETHGPAKKHSVKKPAKPVKSTKGAKGRPKPIPSKSAKPVKRKRQAA